MPSEMKIYNMKKYHISILLGMYFIIPCGVAQIPQLERQVISIGGSCRSNDNIDLCDNVGELAVTTLIASQISLYQGFEQGNESLIISTKEPTAISLLLITPNPVQDQLSITSFDAEVLLEKAAIYDVMGHTYHVKIAQKTIDVIEIDVNPLPSGVYFLVCPSKTKQLIIQKFIKI